MAKNELKLLEETLPKGIILTEQEAFENGIICPGMVSNRGALAADIQRAIELNERARRESFLRAGHIIR